jgi:hypothetical protein
LIIFLFQSNQQVSANFLLRPFGRISILVSETMKTESPIGADQQNLQLPTGPLPEGEPIILVEDEVAAQEMLGLPSHSNGISYHENEFTADIVLRETQPSEGERMPAPKPALDPTINNPSPKSTDKHKENMVDITSSNAPQLHPEVEIVARALAIIGSPNQLSRWMNTSLPALQGQTPYSLMNSEGGRKQVEAVLGRIEHGIY